MVADGTLFIAGNRDDLIAMHAATGGTLWRRNLGRSTYSTPAVVDGTVYMGSNPWYLWAVDAVTGEERWKQETGANRQSSPTVADGTVYIGSEDMSLWAVDAVTGEERWRLETGGEVHSSPWSQTGPCTSAARTASCMRFTPDPDTRTAPGALLRDGRRYELTPPTAPAA